MSGKEVMRTNSASLQRAYGFLRSHSYVFVFAAIALWISVIPLPHYYEEKPQTLTGGVIYPYPGPTEVEMNYKVTMNTSTWWYDKAIRVDVTVTVGADIKSTRRLFNLTLVRFVINVHRGNRFLLLEEDYSGSEGVLQNVSLANQWEEYKIHRVYSVDIEGLSRLTEIGPKIDADFEFLLEVDWQRDTGTEMTTPLSNHMSGGVIDWSYKPFPVLIDDPDYRISGILRFWSLILLPIPAYLCIVLLRRIRRDHEKFQLVERYLYWLSLGLISIYSAVSVALAFGIFIGNDGWVLHLFAVMITVLVGLPISFMATGFDRIREPPIYYTDYYPRYSEVCTTLGVRCRTREELDTTSLMWRPGTTGYSHYDYATGKNLCFILFAESLLIVICTMWQPAGLPLQQVGGVICGVSMFGILTGQDSEMKIKRDYIKWDWGWFTFWELLYHQVIAEEIVYDDLRIFTRIRNASEQKPQSFDIGLICRVLGVSPSTVPPASTQPMPESIHLGVLTWYVRNDLEPKVQDADDELKKLLRKIIRPFKDASLPWKHHEGSQRLLRRAVFARDALRLSRFSFALVQDFSSIVFHRAIRKGCKDPSVIQRVSSFYENSRMNPQMPDMQSSDWVIKLRPWWSMFNAVTGFVIADQLALYI